MKHIVGFKRLFEGRFDELPDNSKFSKLPGAVTIEYKIRDTMKRLIDEGELQSFQTEVQMEELEFQDDSRTLIVEWGDDERYEIKIVFTVEYVHDGLINATSASTITDSYEHKTLTNNETYEELNGIEDLVFAIDDEANQMGYMSVQAQQGALDWGDDQDEDGSWEDEEDEEIVRRQRGFGRQDQLNKGVAGDMY